jgi:hypothetical protein
MTQATKRNDKEISYKVSIIWTLLKFIGFMGLFQICVKFVIHGFVSFTHECHALFKYGSCVHDFCV